MLTDLGKPAARQQGDDRLLGIEPKLSQSFLPAFVGFDGFQKRMADERRIDAVALVKGCLERKDHRHAINPTGDLAYPSFTPRPDLRAHVIENWNAQRLGITG